MSGKIRLRERFINCLEKCLPRRALEVSFDNENRPIITILINIKVVPAKEIDLPHPSRDLYWQEILVIPCLEYNMSLIMRKPAFCICKNNDADQLSSNCAADQRLCFCNIY